MEYLIAIYLAAFASVELADYRFNVPWICQTDRTVACYQWFEHYLPSDYRSKNAIDYSEGLFHDFTETLEEATQKKYEHIFNKLGLTKGMRLLDAGCGTGVWLNYCRNRGVNVVGLTLSEEQARVVRAKGLEVHVTDYRVENPEYINSFDRITALGSSEHVCSSAGALMGVARERCVDTLSRTWRLFGRYLKGRGQMFLTLLTSNQKVERDVLDWLQIYVIALSSHVKIFKNF